MEKEFEEGEIDWDSTSLRRRPGSPYISMGPCYMQKCGVLSA
jgi:hypothetical protein